ncbi:ABC transporter substrate-binding protein [Lacisediminihabitans sp. H27-G8]|uniref:ABC transporter substrate-binding protein n=1 Tax=Lacisediminihabitans sp. H27-G8 TaxID=3111909 RepID=UPI0038FC26DF
MKYVKAVAAAAALVTVVALTGCASGSSGSAKTLSILSNVQPGTPQAKVQARVVAAFEKATGAKVKVSSAGVDIPKVYETSVAGHKEADVVMVNLADTTPQWVKQGIAVPASKYLSKWGLKSKILPEAQKQWTDAKGQVMGFPYSGFVWPVWYNMALLKQAGITAVPTTTDELLADVEKMKAADVPTLVVGGSDWSGNKLFLQIAQSYLSAKQATDVMANGGYCSASSLKGISLFTKLRDAGLFLNGTQGYTSDQMNATFYGAKAAIMSAGSWAFASTPTALQSDVKLGGFPIPSGSSFDKPTAFEGYTGLGFWISKNGDKSDKIDLVKKFITSWYSPTVAAEYAQATSAPVALVSTSNSQTFTNTVTAQAVNDLPGKVAFGVMPDTVVPANLQDAQIRVTTEAYAPGMSAQQICSALNAIYPTK